MGKKAVIAMSGGVDSSVAAYRMKEQGYDCMGITMKLFQNEDAGISKQHSCCSMDDVEDARSVARALGIPYYVLNFRARFQEDVIERFVTAYENGITPNPCIDCNRYLKFDKLYHRAEEWGYDAVVTGHYARIERDVSSGRYLLRKALDGNKDQSYVLYSLTQEQLAHTLFPLGGLKKEDVRAIAQAQGFINAKKHDSQDICFVQEGNYADFIEQYTGKCYPEGDFIDCEGNVIGRHKGIIRYTVGQRRGLGISGPTPMYVCAVNPADHTVTLGEEQALYSKVLEAKEMNFISVPHIKGTVRLKAKVRYRQTEQPAVVTQTGADTIRLEFDEPQRAITRGQSVVLYDGDLVVGGGIIR